MMIKVCGMKYPENIRQLASLPIDLMGFIFYPRSPRYVAGLEPGVLAAIPDRIKKVGVFVNEQPDRVFACMEKYKLDYVQFHGNESVDWCRLTKARYPAVKIIKAFNVSGASDFEKTEAYSSVCDYFLFDTKTSQHGGSGQKFDWTILDAYRGNLPFFLSGGLSADDAELVKSLKHPKLYALDLNSKFETAPGLKDIALLGEFINRLKNK
ncbi:phosphoribosylanthranilate isomerase [Viscerimonas tarda]